MRAWERHEAAGFEEVEDRETQQGRNNAYVTSPVKAVSELNAAIDVVFVCRAKGLEDSEFNARCVSVLEEACQWARSSSVRMQLIPWALHE